MVKREETKNIKVDSKQKYGFWIMLLLLITITGISFYKLFVRNEIVFIQFAIVFALSGTVLKKIPGFSENKIRKWIPIFISSVLLILGIIFRD